MDTFKVVLDDVDLSDEEKIALESAIQAAVRVFFATRHADGGDEAAPPLLDYIPIRPLPLMGVMAYPRGKDPAWLKDFRDRVK